MGKRKYPEAVWFDVTFTVVVFALLIWSLVDFRVVSLFTPLFCVLVGSAFFYCKSYREVSYVAKVLFWISDNVPVQIVKINSIHILIGFLMIGIGIASAVLPSNRDMQRDEMLWRQLRGNASFWFTLVLIVLLNLMCGLYNYYKKKDPGGSSKGNSR
jgi:hypothetical protein